MIASTKQSMSAIRALVASHRKLYAGSEIDAKLHSMMRVVPHSKLSSWDIQNILRMARAVFFDMHVEVVSGHHTGTYLRFESVARFPEFITLIARDMADWISSTYRHDPLVGLVSTASDARLIAERVVELLADVMPLRLVLTPFCRDTGKIGTEIAQEAIRKGERFVSLNDVTTRGMCVSKLGKVITDHGGHLVGMMVFARRDSGQFSLMDELTARLPFYYAADLMMPQWEPGECPMCHAGLPLLSWKDMPEF